MHALETSVRLLPGIGASFAKKCALLGIETCKDLIFYFPFRFDDYSTILPLADVRPGMTVTVVGTVRLIANRRSRARRTVLTEGLVEDDSGSIKVIWFNQSFLTKNILVGDQVALSGKTNESLFDLTLVNPVYEKRSVGEEYLHTSRLVPVYHLTEGLSPKVFRNAIKNTLDAYLPSLSEWLPEEIIEKEHFFTLHEALRSIHFPLSHEDAHAARTRLAFDELFSFQLLGAITRNSLHACRALRIPFREDETKAFIASLPFVLTHAQRTTAWDILRHISKDVPMNRLLEGDVGSGKTVVATLALLNVITAGHQAVVLAPTEILARQHYETLKKLFCATPAVLALITSGAILSTRGEHEGKGKRAAEKNILENLAKGVIQICIGTHALLEERISFSSLGLAIIDEQHRFGVRQRKLLREKNASHCMPHLLSLTATPIPRSLALIVYGDLDLSRLDEVPLGRKKIITKVVPARYREWTYEFIRKEAAKGRQTFVICPTIVLSDTLAVRAATDEYKRLSRDIFPHLRLDMIHGKMKQKEKTDVMERMARQEIDVLVCTSVVEVGIDISNASVMLIEGAERFGLAQLHQFRGRVGRAEYQSYCFLLPSSEEYEELERLQILTTCSDGFLLAEKDLALRGQGDVYGVRQSGMPALSLATLHDTELIEKAHEYAQEYISRIDEFPVLKERIASFEKEAHLE